MTHLCATHLINSCPLEKNWQDFAKLAAESSNELRPFLILTTTLGNQALLDPLLRDFYV